jgi:hypothetical protein
MLYFKSDTKPEHQSYFTKRKSPAWQGFSDVTSEAKIT